MGRVKRSAVGKMAAAAASLVVEVNTSHCAVPGHQLELPGAPRQRKQVKKKTRVKKKSSGAAAKEPLKS